MDGTKFQTSFIPKKAPVGPGLGHSSRVSIFAVVSAVIFFISVGVAGYVFIYHRVLVGRIGALDAELVAAKNSFELSFVSEVTALYRRIEASKQLLAKHTAVTPLFSVLERETLSSVHFTDFDFTAAGGGSATLVLLGEASSFKAVALQSDVFGQEKAFQNPVFSDLSLDSSGNVTFRFTASMDPSLLSYGRTLAGIASPSSNAGAGAPEVTAPTP